MSTEGLIDDRNIELWCLLNNDFEIEIVKEIRDNYSVYTIDNKATIYVPIDNINSSSFTHELLHVFLRSKQIFISTDLTMRIKENKILSRIMSDNLLKHIGNCLDHIKILPLYLKLGYENSEFISDFHIHKLSDNEILNIKRNYCSTINFKKYYSKSAIDFFIGKFFAAVACSNEDFNYREQLIKLKKIDNELFDILELFFIEWQNFDLVDDNPLNRYYTIEYKFECKLENWARKKTIR